MDPRRPSVTVIGDSTIDNKVWVSPGLIGNYVYNRLGIKRDDSATRIEKSHRRFLKPELSVIEHLQESLPLYDIHDYTNDGFTTRDCLDGAYRDKVFGEGRFAMFPHEHFKPLKAAKDDIKNSQYIILSIGGNNVREFLQEAHERDEEFIKQQFLRVLEQIQDEYLKILKKLREYNPDAKIILMTQYYPSFKQNTYKIYPFMKQLGRILELGVDPTEPADVIHAIMQETYTAILRAVSEDNNIVIADITSSLNPFDGKNHTHQIEPSGIGGKKIAQMLKHILTDEGERGVVYQFCPNFFKQEMQPQTNVEKIPFRRWEGPKHPHALINASCHYILSEIFSYRDKQEIRHPVYHYQACEKIYTEGKSLLVKLEELHDKNGIEELTISLYLARNVLANPSPDAISKLRTNAKERAIGKSKDWKKFTGALLILAGVAVLGMSVAGIPFTAGVSLTGMYLGGSLLTAGGAALFYNGREKSLAKSLSTLAQNAEREKRKPL